MVCVQAVIAYCKIIFCRAIFFCKLGPAKLQIQVSLCNFDFQVQVIPWMLSDSNFVCQPAQRQDSSKTVFVGALHGMISAETLAVIMNDLFGNVVTTGIDTDKHKYPIG